MIKKLFFIIASFLSVSMESQNWDSIRGGLPNGQVDGLMFDSVHNELIVSSKFIYKIGNLPVRGIARWNGIRWDSLTGGINTHNKISNPNSPGGFATSCISYNGKLLVGGQFNSIGGINATSLALWDGVKWDSLPKRAFDFNLSAPQITGFYKYNNLLYIYGTFTVIAGQPATGLATWDGNNFSGIVLPSIPSFFLNTSGFIVFNSQVYVSGLYLNTGSGNYGDVLKLNGTSWVSTTGGGLKGFGAGVGVMEVYNNALYAGGHFYISEGNVANNVMRYDGSQWYDVGFGDGSGFENVKKLIVHKSKLWAFGCYATTANMPAFSVSVYDGTKWCALQDTIDNCLNAATVYNDTIYVGGAFWTAGGDSHITNLAKLKDPVLFKSCNGVGIKELNEKKDVRIYPNPVSNTLHIESEKQFGTESTIEITNTLGQVVLKLPYTNGIDVSGISNGCYLVQITSDNNQKLYSKFIKQ